MVKVKLEYNPYLLTTKVEFNNHPPKINSLVEKYQNKMLQTWVDQIPSIFYDEMNGYDFELDFYGTELDFSILQEAFKKKNVSEEEVALFHKNDLDSRNVKIKKIEELLEWLYENPNDKFDYGTFRNNNKDLLDGPYTYIIIKGSHLDVTELDQEDFLVEKINNVVELQKTNLKYTPILFYVNENMINEFQNDLHYVLSRNDIIKDQLFFLIDSMDYFDIIYRIIVDLGVSNPQVVESITDQQIMQYFKLYPITDYLYNTVSLLRKESSQLYEIIDQQNKKAQEANKDIYAKINKLNFNVVNLKVSKNDFINKDNLDFSADMRDCKIKMLYQIDNWRIRRNKISSQSDAINNAVQLDYDACDYFKSGILDINTIIRKNEYQIEENCKKWYQKACVDFNYEPDIRFKSVNPNIDTPSFVQTLTSMEHEETVVKESFSRMFFGADTGGETTIQKIWYLQEFRDYVHGVIENLVNEYISDNSEALNKYYDTLSLEYQNHIDELIDQINKQKAEISLQLSEDEKFLQADLDWINQFIDFVNAIERD